MSIPQLNLNSSHIIIFNEKDQALLLRRSPKDEWMANKLSMPGGRRKESESLMQNIVRETFEETGLMIFPKFIRYLPAISQKLNHIFFTTSKYTGNIKLDHENSEFMWRSVEEIDEIDSVPHLKDEIQAAKSVFSAKIKIKINGNIKLTKYHIENGL